MGCGLVVEMKIRVSESRRPWGRQIGLWWRHRPVSVTQKRWMWLIRLSLERSGELTFRSERRQWCEWGRKNQSFSRKRLWCVSKNYISMRRYWRSYVFPERGGGHPHPRRRFFELPDYREKADVFHLRLHSFLRETTSKYLLLLLFASGSSCFVLFLFYFLKCCIDLDNLTLRAF